MRYRYVFTIFLNVLHLVLSVFGGNPVGTLTECLEQSIVKEAAKGYSAEQMVEELSQDFTNISKQLENAIEIAGNAGDDVSEDMFIGMQTSVDKHNWMFKSYLS